MDSEEKTKLQRALELSEDNNKMLKKLVRSMRWSRLVRVIYWVIIIGASVGTFYFFQPYFDQLIGVYQGFGDVADKINFIN